MNTGAGSRPEAGGLASSTWASVTPSAELSGMKDRDTWQGSSQADCWFLKRKRSLGRATMSLHDAEGCGERPPRGGVMTLGNDKPTAQAQAIMERLLGLVRE